MPVAELPRIEPLGIFRQGRAPKTCRSVRGLIRIAVAALASFILLCPSQAAAARCPGLGDIPVHIVPMHGGTKRDFTVSAAEMRRLVAPELAARHYPLLGMTGAPFGFVLAVNGDPALGDDGLFCPAPESIEVRIGFAERTVFIAREASNDGCLIDAIVAHQMKQVRSDDAGLDDFVPVLTRELRAFIGRQRPEHAPNAELAKSKLSDLLEERIQRLIGAFNQRRGALHKALDSPDELVGLRSACQGRGQRLVGQ